MTSYFGLYIKPCLVLLNSCLVTCSAAIPQREDDDEQRKAKLQPAQLNSGATRVDQKAESADNLRDRKSSTQSSSQRGMGSSLKAYAGVAPRQPGTCIDAGSCSHACHRRASSALQGD